MPPWLDVGFSMVPCVCRPHKAKNKVGNVGGIRWQQGIMSSDTNVVRTKAIGLGWEWENDEDDEDGCQSGKCCINCG